MQKWDFQEESGRCRDASEGGVGCGAHLTPRHQLSSGLWYLDKATMGGSQTPSASTPLCSGPPSALRLTTMHRANQIQSRVQRNTFPLRKRQRPPCWTCTPSPRWAQRDGKQHDLAQEGARRSHRGVRFPLGKSLWKKPLVSSAQSRVSGPCSEAAVPSSAAGLPSATSPVPSATKHQANLQSCNVSHPCPFHRPSLHIPNPCL